MAAECCYDGGGGVREVSQGPLIRDAGWLAYESGERIVMLRREGEGLLFDVLWYSCAWMEDDLELEKTRRAGRKEGRKEGGEACDDEIG